MTLTRSQRLIINEWVGFEISNQVAQWGVCLRLRRCDEDESMKTKSDAVQKCGVENDYIAGKLRRLEIRAKIGCLTPSTG